MHLKSCPYDCNCYTTTTSIAHTNLHCQTCYYDCFDGGYTVNFTVWGPPQFTNTVNEFVINMDLETDVWSYLDRNWPIGFSDTCWYHVNDVDHFEWTVSNGLGALIGGIIALVLGVAACVGFFIASRDPNNYSKLGGMA